MMSKFTKDLSGKPIDLKQKDPVAYNVLKDLELSKNNCVVANFDGKSVLFMYSGISKTDASGLNWEVIRPMMSLPVHAGGQPFYESGTAFSIDERYVELYHEEDADMNHGGYADIAMRKVYVPHIDNAQKSVCDAIEKGMLKQAGYSLSEGRSADGRSFNEIRILDADMSENDRAYCEEACQRGEFTIFSDDASDNCKQFRCTREQKMEIRAGRYGGLPTRMYLDTLERAREIFIARGSNVSELDAKISDRKAFESGNDTNIKDRLSADDFKDMIELLERMRDPRSNDFSNEIPDDGDISCTSVDDREVE